MLATLEKSNDNFDVLFIDDHSEDESVETLRSLGYAVIPKLKASGLTDSWNLGYSHFLKYNYETLFLANNDVLVPDGAIDVMQKLLAFYPFMAPSTTLVGGKFRVGKVGSQSAYSLIGQGGCIHVNERTEGGRHSYDSTRTTLVHAKTSNPDPSPRGDI